LGSILSQPGVSTWGTFRSGSRLSSAFSDSPTRMYHRAYSTTKRCEIVCEGL
jgi:hypothetical protein